MFGVDHNAGQWPHKFGDFFPNLLPAAKLFARAALPSPPSFAGRLLPLDEHDTSYLAASASTLSFFNTRSFIYKKDFLIKN